MDSQDEVPEISVAELKKRLDAGEELVILDIREPHELRISKLNNTFHIPLADLADRLEELKDIKEKEIVIYCRSGRRSGIATTFMQEEGFRSVFNLKGGINAWSDEIDPSVQKY